MACVLGWKSAFLTSPYAMRALLQQIHVQTSSLLQCCGLVHTYSSHLLQPGDGKTPSRSCSSRLMTSRTGAHAHCTAAAPTPSSRMRIDLSDLSRHLSPYYRTVFSSSVVLLTGLCQTSDTYLTVTFKSTNVVAYPINAYDSFSQQIIRWNFPIQVFPSNSITLSDLKGGQESMCKPHIPFIHTEI